jgi:hypothetical protein
MIRTQAVSCNLHAFGRVTQLVRVSSLHGESRGFESLRAHPKVARQIKQGMMHELRTGRTRLLMKEATP